LLCPSVPMTQLCSHWIDFQEFGYASIFFKMRRKKMEVLLNWDKNNWYFTWQLCTVMVSCCINHIMTKSFIYRCMGNQTTHFIFRNIFLIICVFYEIMWKYIVTSEIQVYDRRVIRRGAFTVTLVNEGYASFIILYWYIPIVLKLQRPSLAPVLSNAGQVH
jgi:hypothetical protein